MARSRGDKEYILPIKGINTEANVLHFPQEYCVDSLNMEVDYNPQVVRPRKGLLSSETPQLADTRNVSDHDVGISSFVWENVNNDTDKIFIVVQVGRYLYFFDDDVSLNTDPVSGVHSERIDLNSALSGTVKGTLALLEPASMNYTNTKGKLLLCSEQIDPTLISWDGSAITSVKLNLKKRDIHGIADSYRVDERPIATLENEDHNYNLLNQGWYKQRRLTAGSPTESDPIVAFETLGFNPSNADIVWLGMAEVSGDLIFDAEFLRDQTFGSTPAAKGHYVVDVFNIDRAYIVANPLESGATTTGGASGGGLGDLNFDDWIDIPPLVLP